MDHLHESDGGGSKRRVRHTPVPRLGRNDKLQRESEGEDHGAPKIHNVRHPLGSTTINADTVTTMESPIKSPAAKLPASRSLGRRFFMMHGFES